LKEQLAQQVLKVHADLKVLSGFKVLPEIKEHKGLLVQKARPALLVIQAQLAHKELEDHKVMLPPLLELKEVLVRKGAEAPRALRGPRVVQDSKGHKALEVHKEQPAHKVPKGTQGLKGLEALKVPKGRRVP
jgi:hypothetical protein